jgi:hypothetical protein
MNDMLGTRSAGTVIAGKAQDAFEHTKESLIPGISSKQRLA